MNSSIVITIESKVAQLRILSRGKSIPFNFSFDDLCFEKMFTKDGFVCIPSRLLLCWFNIKLGNVKGKLKYITFISYKVSEKTDTSILEVELSGEELLGLVYQNDVLVALLKVNYIKYEKNRKKSLTYM